jgi:hypothetical protein
LHGGVEGRVLALRDGALTDREWCVDFNMASSFRKGKGSLLHASRLDLGAALCGFLDLVLSGLLPIGLCFSTVPVDFWSGEERKSFLQHARQRRC